VRKRGKATRDRGRRKHRAKENTKASQREKEIQRKREGEREGETGREGRERERKRKSILQLVVATSWSAWLGMSLGQRLSEKLQGGPWGKCHSGMHDSSMTVTAWICAGRHGDNLKSS